MIRTSIVIALASAVAAYSVLVSLDAIRNLVPESYDLGVWTAHSQYLMVLLMLLSGLAGLSFLWAGIKTRKFISPFVSTPSFVRIGMFNASSIIVIGAIAAALDKYSFWPIPDYGFAILITNCVCAFCMFALSKV
jgi:hypothetical protein